MIDAGLQLRIGCSGWLYRHWRGAFYPATLPQSGWFDYYAQRFDSVELNNTFYRLPERSTFAEWRRQAPEEFVFAVKASRFLTHIKRLKDPAEPLKRLFSRASALGPHFGPMLYQLPPRWKRNAQRLDAFLARLPAGRRHAIEFRDSSWYTDAVFACLERHGVALCLHDMAGSATEWIVTAPFIYVRFHGPIKYAGRYGGRVLEKWAAWLATQVRSGRSMFGYFNNDVGGHAPRDAVRLRAELLSELGPEWASP